MKNHLVLELGQYSISGFTVLPSDKLIQVNCIVFQVLVHWDVYLPLGIRKSAYLSDPETEEWEKAVVYLCKYLAAMQCTKNESHVQFFGTYHLSYEIGSNVS